MNDIEAYVRVLTELHFQHSDRKTLTTRIRLQDVLEHMRDKAAQEWERDAQWAQGQAEGIANAIAKGHLTHEQVFRDVGTN